MPMLFSYGTLQDDDIQLSTFGRLLRGQRDALVGVEPALVPIEDPEVVAASGKTHYANIVFNVGAGGRVTGTVFEITDAELAAADGYENPAGYERVSVTLDSGRSAWVYFHPRS